MSALRIIAASSRRRAGDAVLLVASTAFSVMAIGIFTAAAGSEEATAAAAARQSLAILFTSASMVTVLFAVLSGWFFAEHYLSKRRREIATWLLSGMTKRAAFGILAAEFAAAGTVAFLAGAGSGALLSRFFALALAALMRERNPVEMAFGLPSVITAGLACLSQFALASLRILSLVSRISIADLMRSEREAERPPRSRPLLAVSGAFLVLAGYAGAVFARGGLAVLLMIPVLVVTVAGTFLCFGALVPSAAAAFRSRWARGRSESGAAGLIASAQIGFRSRRNARLLALTAVLVAVAATASGTVITLNLRDRQMSRMLCPHDIELSRATDEGMAAVDKALAAAGGGGAKKAVLEFVSGEMSLEPDGTFSVGIFSESAWNLATGFLDEEALSVDEGHAMASMTMGGLSDREGSRSAVLVAGGKRLELELVGPKLPPPVSIGATANPVIVDEESYRSLAEANPEGIRRVALWDGLSPEIERAALPALAGILPKEPRVRVEVLDQQLAVDGALLFIGIFLAAVFILCAVALILFRVIEDSRDDRDRYRVIRELGSTRREVTRSLVLQDLFSFGLPLAFGLAHSVAALIMLKNVTGYDSSGPTLIVAASALPVFALALAIAVDRQLGSSWQAEPATRALSGPDITTHQGSAP